MILQPSLSPPSMDCPRDLITTRPAGGPCFIELQRPSPQSTEGDRMETACGGRCNNVLDHSLRILQHPSPYTGLGLSRGASRRCRSKAHKKARAASINGRCSQPSSVACQAATVAVRAPAATDIADSSSPVPRECEAADLEDILKEKGECGVGFIANLRNERSHIIVEQALTSLGCMEHRGACSADADSGDGAGIMTQIPWKLLKEDIPELNEKTTGVGMLFLPKDEALADLAKKVIEDVVEKEGHCHVVGWRDVPVVHEVVGRMARDAEPRIVQVFLESNTGVQGNELEREFFILRKLIEKERERQFANKGDPAEFYICTLSNKLIVYKGMLRSIVVGQYYKDLKNEKYDTSFAVYHRRFSTNTNPRWPLAQPMRVLGHNGEINTLQGNLNWVASREHSLTNPVWKGREEELLPLCSGAESDSANLDHVAELLMRTGVPAEESLMILVPEAYDNHPDLQKHYPEVVGFYEYYEGLQEGWDGPALLVFSDGEHVGARLDRNGLRPARFWVTSDDIVYVASEVGVLDDVLTNVDNVIRKGRLGPGQTLVADLSSGTFKENMQIAKEVGSRAPYEEWLSSSTRLKDLNATGYSRECLMSSAEVLKLQSANGFGQEDSGMIIEGMATNGAEPTYCMGDDIPLPVLSSRPHHLGDYFKQRFAQVTNPPIDPLREGLVMSLNMRLGKRGNLLQPGPGSYNQLLLETPILVESELEAIKTSSGLSSKAFSLHYASGKPDAMEQALEQLCEDVEKAVADGLEIVILSDRISKEEMDLSRPPIPTLLAVGAVHHHLIRKGMRTETSIVAETAQCFSTHHVALLVGYGAHAICPYLAFETCRQWRSSSRTEAMIKSGKVPDVSMRRCQSNYKKALEKGVLKILSKMGISLLSCYHGAQIFEIYGLGKEVVDFAFKGSVSRIGGMSIGDLQREAESFWIKGFPEKAMNKLEDFGFIQSRPKGEYHANNQQMSKLLHKAIGLGNKGAAPQEAYTAYQQHFRESPASFLRDCLELTPAGDAIPLEEVESAAAIMERFCTGGMSLGAISRETHETIAIAMNRIGGKSNSGEGGEDPQRWENLGDVDDKGNSPTFPHLKGLQAGDVASSCIKQVASGRFGVTPQFLANAEQLEIKIAQGAKPGEGGQLPAKKVSPYIANLRRSKPGVPLISPPPHHDIYSIEDLAQLIYDLHQAAPAAKVSVKLVAQAGIGTVASGVAKANADIIQISGHDGGTGASPISSIKHAGGPFEMGLVETHMSLTQNELRERVILRADGGMRSGKDVMLAAALGADEYGFGTVAMIATGCIMARVCHTNNCPVGVASQREELRARFPGAPADLVNFFHFVAEEVRIGLSELGLKSLDDLIGRADLLKQRDLQLAKTQGLDLSYIMSFAGATGPSSVRSNQEVHGNGPVLDDEILADPEVQDAIKNEGSVHRNFKILNTDRATFGRVGGAVAKLHGDSGFAGNLSFDLEGSAGQSFACFMVAGMKVKLVGEANDYVGKGIAGGEVVIVPPPNSRFAADEASLVGNTCLYGATGGRLFVNGRAGERFAVRNSMAEAVVEGTGDHCCEYMTGGTVVCLGTTGRNIAAGMTGGLAYFYDEEGDVDTKVNGEIVSIQRVCTPAGEQQLKKLIQDHVDLTGSKKGEAILQDWSSSLQKFWQLVPPSEAMTPEASEEAMEGAGVSEERVPARAA